MSESEKSPDELLVSVENAGITLQGSVPAGFENWNPEFSGDMDMVIKSSGDWYHQGGLIKRHELVKLFSSILRRESDGHYYLVTPVEKFRITVELAPFVVVDFAITGTAESQNILFTTNVGDQVIADSRHPLSVDVDPVTHEPTPLLRVRSNLDGLITRALFYHLAEAATEVTSAGKTVAGVWSGGSFFSLSGS